MGDVDERFTILLNQLRTGDKEERLDALFEIRGIRKTKKFISTFLEQLIEYAKNDKDEEIRIWSLLAFSGCRNQAVTVDAMIEILLNDESAKVRSNSGNQIRHQPKNQQFIEPLVQVLSDEEEDLDVRHSACFALAWQQGGDKELHTLIYASKIEDELGYSQHPEMRQRLKLKQLPQRIREYAAYGLSRLAAESEDIGVQNLARDTIDSLQREGKISEFTHFHPNYS